MFDWGPINLAKTPSGWTEKRIEILKELWAQGLSASAIAAELGGVSRSSVLGKVHRLGLVGRQRLTQPRAKPKPRVHRVQRFREVPEQHDRHYVEFLHTLRPRLFTPRSLDSCTLIDLTSETCRWPLWTDANPERLYCGADGADMENKRPYCPVHSQMAYQPRRAA